MPSPQFVEQRPLSLGETKEIVAGIEKRDKELGFLSNRAKEYLETFVTLAPKKREELIKKLNALGVTRLKDEIIGKIVDFMPKTAVELKTVISGYNLTLSKKDMDGIVEVIEKFVKE